MKFSIAKSGFSPTCEECGVGRGRGGWAGGALIMDLTQKRAILVATIDLK